MFRSRPPPHKFLDLIFYQEGKWPNWDPEIKIEVGDYGVIEEETGSFKRAGSIYDRDIRELVPQIGDYNPIQGELSDYHEIGVHTKRSAGVNASAQADIGSLAEASYEGSWGFSRKQGALFVMHKATVTHISKSISSEVLKALAGVPGLKDMGIVTAVWACSGYVRYLSTKGSDNISVKLVADVPVPQAPAATVGGSVTARWEHESGAGVFKKADPREEPIYSGMFVLKTIKKKVFKRGAKTDPLEGFDQYEDYPPPWDYDESDSDDD